MRPTFMGFETATRGLMTNQKALDIVGNNVTNIGVTGYTRQRVDLVSLHVNQRFTRFNQNSVNFAGQGSAVYGVSQIRDKFLDKRFREEYADVGYYGVTSSVLEDLHASMDEISPATMSQAIKKFQDAWNDISLGTTTESVGAANLMAEATKIVQVLRQMSDKIDNVWDQQEYALQQDVNQVNSILARIADLNDTISKERFNSMEAGNTYYQPLELLDQRNVLIDQLAEFGNITYKEQEDGQVTIQLGGHTVVDGTRYEQLQMRSNENDGRFKTVSVFWNDTGTDVNFSTGGIKGRLDMLNGRGLDGEPSLGENFERGIHYYRDKIDQMARTFAEAFNTVVEEADSNGNPYTPAKFKTLFEFSSDVEQHAGNIRISDAWQGNTQYVIQNVMDKIQEGNDSNNYAAKAYARFNDKLDFGEFQGTLNDYINFYANTRLNNDLDFSNSRLEAVSNISGDLLNQIQQVSGVSMEEEGVDMMMYKKAYDAVSRVFTTLDEMLDKLINGTGVVGR